MAILKKKIGVLTGVGNEKIVIDKNEFYNYDTKLKNLAEKLKKQRVEIGIVKDKVIYVKKVNNEKEVKSKPIEKKQNLDEVIETSFIGENVEIKTTTKEKYKGVVVSEEKYWIVLDDGTYLNRQNIIYIKKVNTK